jgi:predicted dehydrogenase
MDCAERSVTLKRVGLYDYDLDNYHSNVYLSAFRKELRHCGFEVAGCTGMRPRSSRAWAEMNGVPYFTSAEALNEAVEYFIILAPANPELHYGMCRDIFPFGKATYVDKTFAPDLRTSKRIFALADKHRVPMQTSSALRYTNVHDYVSKVGRNRVRHMIAWGGGSSFDEYAIHPTEMIVSCMGTKVQRLMRRGSGNHSQILLDYSGNRTAIINLFAKTRTLHSASVTTTEETSYIEVDRTEIFARSTAAILDLFDAGKPNIPRNESLLVRRILDVAEQKRARKGFVAI